MLKKQRYTAEEISHIIDLAWADDVSFDEIEKRFCLAEKDVIIIMRSNLKLRSFKIWRARVTGRKSKHEKRLRSNLKMQFGNLTEGLVIL